MAIYRFLILPLMLFTCQSLANGPHVHGEATLQIAIDGTQLQLSFASPLDSLLGFEHKPRTEKQKAAVIKMERELNQADRLLTPTPAAKCKLISVTLHSYVFDESHVEMDGSHGHADMESEYIYSCARPKELRGLEVKLFDRFPKLHQLKVEAVTPRGQTAAKLTTKRRQITW